MNKIIVTGSSGFVGKHLVELLKRDSENEVFGLDREDADITKYKEVLSYIKKVQPDRVYHLAGFASGAGKDRDLIFDVNVNGTENILKALSYLYNLRGCMTPVNVLLASTAYVYGNTKVCANEKTPTDAKSYYDQSKLGMEKVARKYLNDNIQIYITRASNHAGPGQSLGFVVPDFCKSIASAKKNDTIAVGNLDAKRDLFDVRDCVRAYKTVMERGVSGEVYNIGTGKTISIKEILDKLIKISGKDINYKIDPKKMRPSDISKNCVNPSKISKLGWKPEISLNKTLEESYKYYYDCHPESVSGSTQRNINLNDVYSQWANSYDDYAKEHNMAIKKVHPVFAKLFNKLIKGNGLDLGCGTGLITQIASKYSDEIVGIDINEEMLKKAQQKQSLGGKITYIKADITHKLPFPSEHFDFVISSLAINHIENVEPVFNEVYRVLKKNGVFIFDEPDSGPRTPEQLKFKAEPKKIDVLLKFKHKGGKVWHMHLLEDEIKQLQNIGFKIEEIIEMIYDEEIKSLMKNYKYHEGKNFFNIIIAKK